MDSENKQLEIVSEKTPSLILGENSVEKAAKIATMLSGVIEKQHLALDIEGKKYVMVEGWNILGALMGVFPVVSEVQKLPTKPIKMFLVKQIKWSKKWKKEFPVTKLIRPEWFDPTDEKTTKLDEKESFEEIAYKAIVILKTSGGTEITRAEAMCSNLEEGKEQNDEYSINSMAQTRATGKAFRLAFSWIMKMAGYEATPAEEIPKSIPTELVVEGDVLVKPILQPEKQDDKKKKIKELCDKLDPLLETKEQYEKFVKDKTGFDLVPANYVDIINCLR